MEALVSETSSASILLIEAFNGGSHKQLVESILRLFPNQVDDNGSCFAGRRADICVITLPPTKWHWRARTGALALAGMIPRHSSAGFRLLFTSAVFNLAELLALRPDLSTTRKILFFHENQLAYPLRRARSDKDYQFGYNQVLSVLVADRVLFNSAYNMRSFYKQLPAFLVSGLPTPPSPRVPNPQRLVQEILLPKSSVLYYLVDCPPLPRLFEATIDTALEGTGDEIRFLEAIRQQARRIIQRSGRPLKILWNHRWDYDKNPVDFFKAIFNIASLVVESNFFDGAGETLRNSVNRSVSTAPALPLRAFNESSFPLASNFQISVLGACTEDIPEVFSRVEARLRSAGLVATWGYLDSRDAYWQEIADCDVVVSTADHEFFGVAVVEAVSVGCIPLLPDRLAYPELLRAEHKSQVEGGCLYTTQAQFEKRLRRWIRQADRLREIAAAALLKLYLPEEAAKNDPRQVDVAPWLTESVFPGVSNATVNEYCKLFRV